MKTRIAFSAAIALALLAFVAVSPAALADFSCTISDGTDLHASQVGADSTTFQTGECGVDITGTQVDWHFVLVQTTAENTGTLHVCFQNSGCQDVHYDKSSGGVLHWDVITPDSDILLGACTDAVGGILNLSHVCYLESPPPPHTNAITACKFFDANGNGGTVSTPDNGDTNLSGWPMTIDPLDGGIPTVATQLTDTSGCVTWTELVDGTYTITEGTPNELNWVHSTPVSQQVAVDDSNSNPTVYFGNYCLQASGGLTLGFWSNRNGQRLVTANDLTFLSGLCLVDANGNDFNPSSASALATWLLNANATNMAYMLSAQLAAMELNVRHNFVDGNAFDLCSNKTINALMADANTLLCADGYTPAGDPNRAPQEADKNCLDALNNGGSVIPTTPCPYTFPTE